jgi:sarcosine oxidase
MRVAVVGAGVVGLATTAALLRRGVDVTCFERTGRPMAERSAGSSRIFRLAHGTPELVRVARAAQAGYARWSEEAGAPLVRCSGCVVSGGEWRTWAAAMRAADATVHVVGEQPGPPRLPARVQPQDALVDLAGGVIDVDGVRRHLAALTAGTVVGEQVDAIDPGPGGVTVRTAEGSRTVDTRFDAVVVAAGTGTSALAAQVGVETPAALHHHVRFTFPLRAPGPWPAWIDEPAGGLGTYQHQDGPGTWTVGGHLDPALTAWEVGREAATAASERAVLEHARQHLDVEPRVVDRLYCAPHPGLGDGFDIRRSGAVLVAYGENLFKMAPVLGELLATGAVEGSTPTMRDAAGP